MSETARRLSLAGRIVQRLAQDPHLAASVVVGSVARGTADERSDLDLLNYYAELPDPEAFDRVMAGCGAERELPLGPATPEQFLAQYRLEGVAVQTGAQSATALEAQLGQIAAGEVNWATAKIASGLMSALPLHGEELVRGWQERVRYPEPLRRREIEANLGIFPIWSADAQLVARDAQLFRRQMLVEGAFRVLAILSALNRVYFSAFQFKSLRAHLDLMPLKPPGLAERLDRLADGDPAEGAELLRGLVEEVKAIVRRELPDLEVERPWRPAPP